MSVWRKLHFALALVVGAFLFCATLTGIVLAVESLFYQQGKVTNSDETLADLLPKLDTIYQEVYAINKDENNYLLANVLDRNDEFREIVIHPNTGEELTLLKNEKTRAFFDFNKTLHRSLFMHTSGRVAVMLTSFLLLLISCTGILLIKRKKGSWKYFFKKTTPEKNVHYLHSRFAGLFLLPIAIIAITGISMSLKKFEFLPDKKFKELPFPENLQAKERQDISTFVLFQKTPLKRLVSLEYPFSSEPEDYFFLTTNNQQYHINQYDGTIIQYNDFGNWNKFNVFVFDTHTANFHWSWTIILILTCIVILLLMYTGYSVSIKRRSRKTKNTIDITQAKYIVAYASENGSTARYAHQVFNSLANNGYATFISTINDFPTEIPNRIAIIILASTYGDGDAPSNGRKHLKFIETLATKEFRYTVLGFGSMKYPKFCSFASSLDQNLMELNKSEQILPIHKINDQSHTDIQTWYAALIDKLELKAPLEPFKFISDSYKKMKVKEVKIDPGQDIFQVVITNRYFQFSSGDLLKIIPGKSELPRYYSIAKTSNNDICITVKKIPGGLCSNLLYHLKKGDYILGKIQVNEKFHLNNKPRAILIANGTGIGPFLGQEYQLKQSFLFWGMPTLSSTKNILTEDFNSHFTEKFLAISRERDKKYVQHLISKHAEFFKNEIKKQTPIFICGSIAMKNQVLEELDTILVSLPLENTDELIAKGLIKEDCY